MAENVVYRGMRPAPARAAQGGAFAVLAQKLGAGQAGDEGFVPESPIYCVACVLTSLKLCFQTAFFMEAVFCFIFSDDLCFKTQKAV